ncbi:hypothetical protein ACSFBI_23125 [Variovorax sp. RB3P1]|uniref:hypothetical protein n=1 Tax=Variovorax sp. RB3P1 TaxID=3443732 RepID=UPI003F47DA4B
MEATQTVWRRIRDRLTQGRWQAVVTEVHRVPLSMQAMQLLKGLERIEGSEMVFPGRKPLQPLSDMSLTACMRRMDWAPSKTSTSRVSTQVRRETGKE